MTAVVLSIIVSLFLIFIGGIDLLASVGILTGMFVAIFVVWNLL